MAQDARGRGHRRPGLPLKPTRRAAVPPPPLLPLPLPEDSPRLPLPPQVCGDEGHKSLRFTNVSGCFGNTPLQGTAAVNGIAEWVCNGQARVRRVGILTKVKYNKSQ